MVLKKRRGKIFFVERRKGSGISTGIRARTKASALKKFNETFPEKIKLKDIRMVTKTQIARKEKLIKIEIKRLKKEGKHRS